MFARKKIAKTTEEILEGCRRNDAGSQEKFFKRYAPTILTTCRRYARPYFGAHDLLQETFVAVFEKIHQYDSDKGKIETWMKRIAVNTALKVLRNERLDLVDMPDDLTQVADESEYELDAETISMEQVLDALKKMPVGYQTVFNMYIFDGFMHSEIAEILNISANTSKSQLSKAKKMLKEMLTTTQKQSDYRLKSRL